MPIRLETVAGRNREIVVPRLGGDIVCFVEFSRVEHFGRADRVARFDDQPVEKLVAYADREREVHPFVQVADGHGFVVTARVVLDFGRQEMPGCTPTLNASLSST